MRVPIQERYYRLFRLNTQGAYSSRRVVAGLIRAILSTGMVAASKVTTASAITTDAMVVTS
jgi:hypothetical protein